MRRLDFVEGTIRPTMVLLFLLALMSFYCEEEELKIIIPPHVPTLAITVDDVGVTEAWLKIESIDSTALGDIILKHDTTVVLTANVTTRETLVVSEQLLPKKTYIYKAYKLTNNTPTDSTTPLQLTTMDTTSHNFTWTFDTLGEWPSSILYDVAIINDTCAYAVGENDIGDSVYNFAKWNGTKWKFRRVLYKYQNNEYYSKLTAIIYFNENNFWVASNQPMHWNGTQWELYDLSANVFNGYVSKMWGASSEYLYIVGRNGAIAHYNGTEWKKINSGITLDIQDIWGAKNPKTGEMELLAVASDKYTGQGKRLLKIIGESVTALPDSGPRTFVSVWFTGERNYYIAGSGIWKHFNPKRNIPWRKVASITTFPFYTESIRGNGINDIVITGDYGDMGHFNGQTWKSFYSQTRNNGTYRSVAIQKNLVVAVGDNNGKAIIARGIRR
ncbi:MAG: hypothetical protein HYZ34_12255 [Ignavibacteriae bacterium]|nr:hypothetical protein [Ignavibacteriota bacterium]